MRFAASVGMKTTLLTVSIALALGTLAGCDRDASTAKPSSATPPSTPSTSAPAPSAPAGSGSTTAPANTPSKNADVGTPSPSGKNSASQPPVQGREDVRQPEQRRDFEHKGDGAGPKPGG